MRIAIINMLHVGSTGKIMFGIAEQARRRGHQVRTFSPRVYMRGTIMPAPFREGHTYFGDRRENMLHTAADRLFGLNGCLSCFGTMQLIRQLKAFRPDVVHLHNLHNQTISLPMLFRYLCRAKIRVVWTFHDCWPMTGRCPHFAMAGCPKWQTGCGSCPQIKQYPRAYIDQTHMMWRMKQKWFTGVENMVIVTPSRWLADIVQRSGLRQIPVRVIHNGIDLAVFRPVQSTFRARYGCERRKIVLGVAFDWDRRKGLDVFCALAARLPADYQIVLVGGNDQTDRELPANVIPIHRTQDQHELAEIYSAADVFVNPTREDNFPTVNLEALACGTPVVTFDTGGSPECIDETCGIVVPCDDVDALQQAIIHVVEDQPFTQEACVKRAQGFDQKERFAEYVDLYCERVGHA